MPHVFIRSTANPIFFCPLIAALFMLSAATAIAQPVPPRVPDLTLRTFGLTEAPVGLRSAYTSRVERRPARPSDAFFLTLGGLGGGLGGALLSSALGSSAAVNTVGFGLGVAAGTTLIGFRVDGSPLGAFSGAAIGTSLIMLGAAKDDGGSWANGSGLILMGLVAAPVLSAAGYMVVPKFQEGRVSGLTLQIKL